MHDDFFMLIESYRLEFTVVEQVIADYFLAKQPAVTMAELGKELAVSNASITRFSKKLQLNNYKELLFLYKLALTNKQDIPSVASVVTAAYHSLATRSDQMYDEVTIDAFCQLIHQHKIIHFLGKGFNAYVGMDFQFKFSRLGKYVRIMSDANSMALSVRAAQSDELLVVASLRGDDNDLLNALSLAEKKGIATVLITANPTSQLQAVAQHTLITAGLSRIEALGSISPQIPMLLQLDMVYERYLHLYPETSAQWLAAEEILHQ